MKKNFYAVLGVILIVVGTQVQVNAGGCHGSTKNVVQKHNSNSIAKTYHKCDIEDCDQYFFLSTDGSNNATHRHTGHVYNENCTIDGCTNTSNHHHDDLYFYNHTKNDGHKNHYNCGDENCTNTNEHKIGNQCTNVVTENCTVKNCTEKYTHYHSNMIYGCRDALETSSYSNRGCH